MTSFKLDLISGFQYLVRIISSRLKLHRVTTSTAEKLKDAKSCLPVLRSGRSNCNFLSLGVEREKSSAYNLYKTPF